MDMTWYRRRGLMVTPHIERVTGAIASFNSDYNKIPVKSLICSIEPIQEGEGDPSPDNVRPISGQTGLNVVRSGKNLLPANSFMNTTKQGLTYTVNDDGTVSVSGTATASSYIAFQTNFSEDVIINGVPEINGVAVAGTSIQLYSDVSGIGGYIRSNDISMVIPANRTIVIRLRVDSGTTVENALFKPMARISADTDYSFEPYKGTEFSVNWETEAGTVYGGSLDVVSGKLTVNRAKVVFDGTQNIGVANWKPYESSSAWLYNPAITPGIKNVINSVETVCDKLKSIPYESSMGGIYGNNIGIGIVGTSAYAIGIRVPVSGLTTAALINAWLSENPITAVYKLATPTEIQLTPQEVRTLLGENNIWSDSGDVSIDYWKWGN